MVKKLIVEEIKSRLLEELRGLTARAPASDTWATPEDERRAGELQALLLTYRFLPLRDYGSEDVACPAALVELELATTVATQDQASTPGIRAHYFLVPRGGGWIMNVEGRSVQVLTVTSPLGAALLGKKAGDRFRLESRGNTREYAVIRVE